MITGIVLFAIVLYVISEVVRALAATFRDKSEADEMWKSISYNSPDAAHHMTCGEIDRYAREARAAREQYNKDHDIFDQ